MSYGNMPLYPAMRPGDCEGACVKVPLFEDCCGGPNQPPPLRDWKRVALENPRRPGEWVEVLLAVDECGSLTLCVHRNPEDCRPNPPCCRPKPPCRPRGHGRLYGSW